MDTLIPFIAGIVMTASTTSMTGGVHAGAGETVKTGDAYSSVHVENIINAGTQGGTSKTIIKTNTNGTEYTEEKTEVIPASGSFKSVVATSSRAQGSTSGARSEMHVKNLVGTSIASSSVVIKAAGTSSTALEARGIGARITGHISWIFKTIFGWW